jgi:hypothetical protein
MGSPVHLIDPKHHPVRAACRTRETQPLLTEDEGLATCRSCKAILDRWTKKKSFRMIGSGRNCND